MNKTLCAALLGALAMTGCSGYGNPSPGSPDGLGIAPSGAIVIDVVGENGARSFSPNPASVPPGSMVSWHNVDSIVHHVVLNDGAVDSGNIAPGRFSAAMPLLAAGGYHCTIHPAMVGTIVSQ